MIAGMKSTARSLWTDFVKQHWIIYVLGMLSVAITAITQVLLPMLIGWGIDLFKGGPIPEFFLQKSQKASFEWIFFIIFINVIIMMLARSGWRITLGRTTHKSSAHYKAKIWQHARYLSRSDLNTKFTIGNLMNLSTSDVGAARFLHGFTLIGLFDVIFLGLFSLIAMFYVNWQMAIFVLIIVPILPYFIYKLTKLEMHRWEKTQEFLTKFNEQVSRAIETVRLQRLTQTGEFWKKRLEASANDYRRKRLLSIFTSFRYYPLIGLGTLFSYLVLFGVGIYQVFNNVISVGEFVAFQGFVFLLQEPLMEAGYIVSEVQKGRTSMRRLADMFNTGSDPAIKQIGEDVIAQQKVFSVQGLNLSYEDNHVLKNISFDLYESERLGILGPIGSGKSTLLEVLAGLNQNYTGDVYFNDKDIRVYSHEALRKEIVLVQQKSFLFADTVRNNICLDLEVSDSQIWEVLELACLAEDIRSFELGLDTSLGEWGINLSGGQKQRLTLARALIRSPRYLLLDDCLSAVDTVTEDRILKNLNNYLKNSTLIWVAHRRSTLKYCDQILELGHE